VVVENVGIYVCNNLAQKKDFVKALLKGVLQFCSKVLLGTLFLHHEDFALNVVIGMFV
jgi:hypothetical protein